MQVLRQDHLGRLRQTRQSGHGWGSRRRPLPGPPEGRAHRERLLEQAVPAPLTHAVRSAGPPWARRCIHPGGSCVMSGTPDTKETAMELHRGDPRSTRAPVPPRSYPRHRRHHHRRVAHDYFRRLRRGVDPATSVAASKLTVTTLPSSRASRGRRLRATTPPRSGTPM